MLILRPSPVKPRTKPLLGCAQLAPAARYPCLQRCDFETIPRINNRLEDILVPTGPGLPGRADMLDAHCAHGCVNRV